MFHVSAFSDEIAPDFETQLKVLCSHSIQRLDLRSAWGKGVLSLSDDDVVRAKALLAEYGVRVAAIGSPIGKTPIDGDEKEFRGQFERCLELARTFCTTQIRIFSFYLPRGQTSWVPWKEAVLARCRWMAQRAEQEGVVLHHENEKAIFGELPGACADLLEGVDRAAFRAVFDFANFVQAGVTAVAKAYQQLDPWVAAFHLKDARSADGVVVPAGEGDGEVEPVLRRAASSGRDYPMTIEPHLGATPGLSSMSGEDQFGVAVAALRKVMDAVGARWD